MSTTNTTAGFDAIISQFRAKADDLAIRANACLTEAADLMELASKPTPTDEMTDPLLDSHIGGLAHRDGKAQFRECCRKDADRATDLASSLLRESHRLFSMADQLTHPAGHAPMLPTPLLGVPAAPQTEAEDAKASRLAAAAEAWAANEIDEDEPVGDLCVGQQLADVMFGPAVQELTGADIDYADQPCEQCGRPCPSIAPLGRLPQQFLCHECFRDGPKSLTPEEAEAEAVRLPSAPLAKIGLENGQTMYVPADDHTPAPVPAEEVVATTAANSPALETPPAPLAPVSNLLSDDEARILALLDSGPLTEIRIRQALNVGKAKHMTTADFSAALASLQTKGCVEKKRGKYRAV